MKQKLGVPATATDADIEKALDAAVTLANEACLTNAGTSEGVKKSWETRKGGGAAAPAAGDADRKLGSTADDERFVKDRNPALPKRETPEQAGYKVVHQGKDFIHVQDDKGKKEEWGKNDGHASYGLRHQGHDFEFRTSSPEHFSPTTESESKANESTVTPAKAQEQFRSLVNEEFQKTGNYDKAFANVKFHNPELVAAMQPKQASKPAPKQEAKK